MQNARRAIVCGRHLAHLQHERRRRHVTRPAKRLKILNGREVLNDGLRHKRLRIPQVRGVEGVHAYEAETRDAARREPLLGVD